MRVRSPADPSPARRRYCFRAVTWPARTAAACSTVWERVTSAVRIRRLAPSVRSVEAYGIGGLLSVLILLDDPVETKQPTECGEDCLKEATGGIVGWFFEILGWIAGAAFVFVGVLFCVAYFSQFGSERAVRALGAATIGCVVISAASAIANQMLTKGLGI